MPSILTRVGAALLIATSLTLSAQGPGKWQPLFNDKDFSGWTVLAGGGRGGGAAASAPTAPPSTNPEDRGWKIENGVITSVPPAAGQRGGSLATLEKFKDVELELDFMLAEAGTRCTPKLGEKQANLSEDKTCTFNSGVTLRNAYQLNLGRREAGEYIGIVVHRTAPEAILPSGTHCGKCAGTTFRKEMDIIDVWFESGSSHAAVLGREPNLPWPADLYLEGSDQYRGWFRAEIIWRWRRAISGSEPDATATAPRTFASVA